MCSALGIAQVVATALVGIAAAWFACLLVRVSKRSNEINQRFQEWEMARGEPRLELVEGCVRPYRQDTNSGEILYSDGGEPQGFVVFLNWWNHGEALQIVETRVGVYKENHERIITGTRSVTSRAGKIESHECLDEFEVWVPLEDQGELEQVRLGWRPSNIRVYVEYLSGRARRSRFWQVDLSEWSNERAPFAVMQTDDPVADLPQESLVPRPRRRWWPFRSRPGTN